MTVQTLIRQASFGRSDVHASVVGLGTWVTGGWMWGGTDESESIHAIHEALDLGMNLIDTAPIYGFGRAEEVVGSALAGRRDRAVLMTKCGQIWHAAKGTHAFDSDGRNIYHYLGPESVRYELEQSLRRLRTDYIDVYLLHVPDPTTPPEAAMETLHQCQAEGKIRALGVSNMTAEQLRAYDHAGPLAVDQEKYSLLDRQIEQQILPYCQNRRVSLVAYSPLVQGLLTGKIGPGRVFTGDDMRRENSRFRPENLKKIAALLDELRPVAERHQLTLGQLAIAWTIARSPVTHVLVGARTAAQVKENAPAADAQLTNDDLTAIAAALQNHAAEIP